jgi:hypothetical protein
VPCLTLRDTTERPVTVTVGTNVIIGRDMNLLCRAVEAVLNGEGKNGGIPPLWDGRAADEECPDPASDGIDGTPDGSGRRFVCENPRRRNAILGSSSLAGIYANALLCFNRCIIRLLEALAQTSPVQPLDLPSGLPQHHRHDDDDEKPPASAANVLPDSPVITIEGICDHSSGEAALSRRAMGRESSAADLAKKDSSAGLGSACKTIVTKAQFEKLVEALNPQMPATVRRQLAESYPRLLLFANKARELELDRDPRFAEAMQFASMQLLTQRLNRYFEERASSVSDADVEKYYKANAIKFEREELLRILVPTRTRQAQKAGSGEYPNTANDSPMLMVAEKIRVRLLPGKTSSSSRRKLSKRQTSPPDLPM